MQNTNLKMIDLSILASLSIFLNYDLIVNNFFKIKDF